MESYNTVHGEQAGEYEEKKSRFIGRVRHVGTEEEALAFLNEVRAENPMARHNCYAYILRAGNRVRYSDDGEPQKTAGMPILTVLQHAGLYDTACVVTRYFGGTLLGTGGLVRAYTTATQRALEDAEIVTFSLCRDIEIVVEYPDFDALQHWLETRHVVVVGTEYSDVVTLTIRTLDADAAAVEAAVESFCQGRALVSAGNPDFRPLPADAQPFA